MRACENDLRKPYIKYFRNGTSIDMSFKPNVSTHNKSKSIRLSEFNSYKEWRKACNYNQTQNAYFVDLISSNSKLFTFQQCIDKFNQCIQANIPVNDILIAMLYLSCHHFSPHCMSIIKYILDNYYDKIDLYVTSISSPQYTIPHVSAMNGDISLLQAFYNLNGDINVKDGRGVLPITISIAERHLQFFETLLWMNSDIPLKQLSMFNERPIHDIAPFVAAFINFIDIIDQSKELIGNELKIPKELIDILIDYTLPIKAYHGIKGLLEQVKRNKMSQWMQIEQMAMDKLNYDKELRYGKDGDYDVDEEITIGVDYERDLSSMTKMVTKIYVKPTRKEGRVQMRDDGNPMMQQVLKLTVLCSIVIVSASIIWRKYKPS